MAQRLFRDHKNHQSNVVQSEPNGWDAAGCMTDIFAMRVSGVSRVCRQLEHVRMRWAWDVGQFVRNL